MQPTTPLPSNSKPLSWEGGLRQAGISHAIFLVYSKSVVFKHFIPRTTSENICDPKYHHYDRCYKKKYIYSCLGLFSPILLCTAQAGGTFNNCVPTPFFQKHFKALRNCSHLELRSQCFWTIHNFSTYIISCSQFSL